MNRLKVDQLNISPFDSETDILVKIASELNSVPELLYFPENSKCDESKRFCLNLIDDGEVFVANLIDIIRKAKSVKNLMNSLSEISEIKISDNVQDSFEKIVKKLHVKPKDILLLFIFFKIDEIKESLGEEGKSFINVSISELLKDISKFSKVLPSQLDDIEVQAETLTRKIQNEIEKNKQRVKDAFVRYQKFEDIVPVPHTEFKMEKYNVEAELNFSSNLSLNGLLNSIILKEDGIICASTRRFTKIISNLSPPELWGHECEYSEDLKNYPDKMCLKILFQGEYFNVIIHDKKDDIKSKIVLITNTRSIDWNNILTILTESIVNVNFKIGNTVINKIFGVFYYQNERLNKYVLLDLIMNNPMFSVFSVNESQKVSKRKSGVSVRFNGVLNGISTGISFRLLDRIAFADSPEMFERTFPPGTELVRVRITGSSASLEQVMSFIQLLSKYIDLYKKEYNSIVKIYQQYIPNFGEVPVPVIKKSKNILRDRAPGIFFKNYVYRCNTPPVIISDEEAKIIRDEKGGKYKVMTFPKQEDSIEGVAPVLNYTCKHKNEKYPTLRENNNSVLGYIPCCGTNKPYAGSGYNKYFKKIKVPKIKKQSKNIKNTFTLLQDENKGDIPLYLLNILEKIDNTGENYVWKRLGMPLSPVSFLYAMITATQNYKNKKTRDVLVNKLRQDIFDTHALMLAKQELYDKNKKEIKSEYAKKDAYIDPLIFIDCLEEILNCNIYVFSSDKDEKLLLPKYTQGYFKIENKRDFAVVIYLNKGKEGNLHQCELVMKYNKFDENDNFVLFKNNSHIFNGLKTIFDNLRSFYIGNCKNTDPELKITDDMKLISQYIDSYGKTRQITVQISVILENSRKNYFITINTSPLQPQAVKIVEELSSSESSVDIKDINVINLVLKNIGCSKIKQYKDRIKGFINKTVFIIYFKTEIQEKSIFKIFQETKLIAEYLKYKITYMYSVYVKTKKLDYNVSSLESFFKKKILLDNSYVYDYTRIDFSNLSLKFATHKKKLILNSEDLSKRLFYFLKLEIVKNLKTIVDITSSVDYYEDTSNFISYPGELIVASSIENPIYDKIRDSYKTENIIWSNTIKPETLEAYFFKNIFIQGIYLAQNTISGLEEAFELCKTWREEGYNKFPNFTFTEEENEQVSQHSFILYTFEDPTNIKKYLIKGEEENKPYRICVYKLEDESIVYTALLDLGECKELKW